MGAAALTATASFAGVGKVRPGCGVGTEMDTVWLVAFGDREPVALEVRPASDRRARRERQRRRRLAGVLAAELRLLAGDAQRGRVDDR